LEKKTYIWQDTLIVSTADGVFPNRKRTVIGTAFIEHSTAPPSPMRFVERDVSPSMLASGWNCGLSRPVA